MFIQNVPKLKPYVAIKALLTMIIPTDVTILKDHEATSRAVFRSALLTDDIFNLVSKFSSRVLVSQIFMQAKIMFRCQKICSYTNELNCLTSIVYNYSQ